MLGCRSSSVIPRRSTDCPETSTSIQWSSGTPYEAWTDSVVGKWLVNLLSGQLNGMCMGRKRIVCQCGCRVWCTKYTVCVLVEWCLRCFADGDFPCHFCQTRTQSAPNLEEHA